MSMKPIELLLVEDGAGDILLMKQALARESTPISIHVAVDGKQAMEMLAARPFQPDLVILDLNLPKISGLSLLERFHPDVPVIVFTSSTNPRDRERCLELGAKECVLKPTDLDDYRHVVSQIVRNWERPKRERQRAIDTPSHAESLGFDIPLAVGGFVDPTTVMRTRWGGSADTNFGS